MRVEELMKKDARVCREDDLLCEAARVMWESDCGFAPVVATDGSGRVVGAITDRDVCMASYTRGKSLHELRVSEAMSSNVRTCSAGDPLTSAAAEMRAARVRRLLVVDAAGQLLGVLSLADLARAFASSRASGHRGVTATELADVLAAVCELREISGSAA